MVKVEQKKMGRPTDNPKSKPIHVRLDDESTDILNKYCNQEDLSRAEGISHGIKMLESKIKEK